MSLTLARPILTPRLEIRPVERHDLAALMAVNGDPQVTRFLPYRPWCVPADGEAWFDRMQDLVATGTALQLVVVLRDGDRPIGTVLLFRYLADHGRAELGYVLGRAHWGQGLMREALRAAIDQAFGPLQLRRLEADVNPANQSSQRILQALGFAREGRLRQRWMHQGTPQDALIYGLLADDWKSSARD